MTFTWFLSQCTPVEAWKSNYQQLSLLDFLVGVTPVCSVNDFEFLLSFYVLVRSVTLMVFNMTAVPNSHMAVWPSHNWKHYLGFCPCTSEVSSAVGLKTVCYFFCEKIIFSVPSVGILSLIGCREINISRILGHFRPEKTNVTSSNSGYFDPSVSRLTVFGQSGSKLTSLCCENTIFSLFPRWL